MALITAAILARDSQDDISECLESVKWADEVLVILDSRSIDRTEQIARLYDARVLRSTFVNFAQQRNFGLKNCRTEWLFYIDSDERATPELEKEIRQQIYADDHEGWWVPRRNFIWGQEIRHGGWYPDFQLRLLKVSRAHYDPDRQVHEVVILDGSTGYLENPLIHYNYRTMREFRVKQQHYTDLEADILFEQRVHPHFWTYITQPLRVFGRRYFGDLGILDGVGGLVLNILVAYYYGYIVTVKLGKRWRQTQV